MDAGKLLRHVGDVSGMAGLFFEAAETERKLPGVLRKNYRVAWPDFPRDPSVAYGYAEASASLGAATASEITRYDAALDLSRKLEPDDFNLVWACAHSAVRRRRGPAWSQIGRIVGTHPATVKRDFERSMLQLWYALLAEKNAD